MKTRFVPIIDYKPKLDSIDLTMYAWTLTGLVGDYSMDKRIDFLDERWRPDFGPKLAITHEMGEKYKYQETEKWALKKILRSGF